MNKALSLLILCLGWSSAHGQQAHQSIDSIHDAVESFAYQSAKQRGGEDTHVEVRVGRIDRRLRLPACSQPLRTDFKHGNAASSRFTVQVDCPTDAPWTLYVPVAVKRYAEVVAASRRLARDTIITAQDLMLVKKELSSLRRGYIRQPSRLIGKKTKRTLSSRVVIRDHAVAAPSDIHKGESVVISAKNPMINIRMAGTAMNDGSIGELIKVKNRSSNKMIEAEIVRPGVVQVRM